MFCESAFEFDLSLLGQVKELRRRSAVGPTANDSPAPLNKGTPFRENKTSLFPRSLTRFGSRCPAVATPGVRAELPAVVAGRSHQAPEERPRPARAGANRAPYPARGLPAEWAGGRRQVPEWVSAGRAAESAWCDLFFSITREAAFRGELGGLSPASRWRGTRRWRRLR